jgi:hypothetical protein
MNVEVNYLAVLLASVASMVLGFLWYSPDILGKSWMKEKGYTSESLKKAQSAMGKLYTLSFVVSLFTAYMLSHVMTLSQNYYQYPMIQTGISTALFMWLGFMFPVQITATIFGDKNWRLLGIDTGYQLVSTIAMALVIAMLS